MNELHEILCLLFGVSKNYKEQDLKQAYRKIANQFHPDKNKDIDPNVFIALSKGYEILVNKINDSEKPNKKENVVNLDEDTIEILAHKKLNNVFKDIVSGKDTMSLLQLDFKKYIIEFFNVENTNVNHKTANIRNERVILYKVKNRIKCNKDSSFIRIINEVIESKTDAIKINKNKIKVNTTAIELLEEYTFKDFDIFLTKDIYPCPDKSLQVSKLKMDLF